MKPLSINDYEYLYIFVSNRYELTGQNSNIIFQFRFLFRFQSRFFNIN